jgi:hypothetical protein
VEAAWVRRLFRGFGLPLAAAIAWTILQTANPEHGSIVLAGIGLRSYWLWWVGPLIVATALRDEGDWYAAITTLGVLAIAIAAYAAIQFEFPANAPINRYAWDANSPEVASVGATGRVRVTSTFSYISGFAAFATLTIPVLLGVGLGGVRGWRRTVAFVAAAALAATVSMNGSRAPVILAIVGAIVVALRSGLFGTRNGRRITLTLLSGAALAWWGGREGIAGVESRFRDSGDEAMRVAWVLQALPPLAILQTEFPAFGIGTGMQQNARVALGVRAGWDSEPEPGRYLIELGLVGYLLVWIARLGLVAAGVRAAAVLARAGKRALAGCALALAGLSFIGTLTFDHVWQALFFLSAGLVLKAVAATGPIPIRNVAGHRQAGTRSYPA